jgi:hypothetical protein
MWPSYDPATKCDIQAILGLKVAKIRHIYIFNQIYL